jgi:hypothetical protein
MLSDDELAAIRERAELWAIRVPDHPGDDTAAYVHVGDESTAGFIASARGDIPALLAEVDRLTRIVAANHEGANYAEELLTKQCTEVDRLRARVAELEQDRDKWERRFIDLGFAIAELLHNTDGEPLDDEAEIPAGEIRRVLAAVDALSTSQRDRQEASDGA